MKKILGVVLALTIAFAMTACGAQEDGVHAVSTSKGFKCETCAGSGKKVSKLLCDKEWRRPLPLLKLQMVLFSQFVRII